MLSASIADDLLEILLDSDDVVDGSLYLALHEEEPSEEEPEEVPEEAGYSRTELKDGDLESAEDDGAWKNAEDITWEDMPECEVTYIALWDSDEHEDGNLIWAGATEGIAYVSEGDIYELKAGDITATIE